MDTVQRFQNKNKLNTWVVLKGGKLWVIFHNMHKASPACPSHLSWYVLVPPKGPFINYDLGWVGKLDRAIP